jgi:hypothetical protein
MGIASEFIGFLLSNVASLVGRRVGAADASSRFGNRVRLRAFNHVE